MLQVSNSIKYFIYQYIINKSTYLQKFTASLKSDGLVATLKKIYSKRLTPKEKAVVNLLRLKPVKNIWKPSSLMIHEVDISVIIPTYNRAHMLGDLIKSWRKVAEATRYSFEIIFSDDGSSDNSVEILKTATDLPIVILANNHGGAAKARNAAIAKARGKKLLIIGDDIFPNPQILNQHYEKLKALPITDVVLGECVWHPNLKVNHLMDHITTYGQEQFSFDVLPKNAYTDFRHFYTCNISIDREFLLSEDIRFDESFYKVNFEDIELGYRLAKKGMKIFYYPEASGEHFHPYTDVRKFCIRQETVGEMALVFKQLHEEAEVLLDISKIRAKWNHFFTNNSSSNTTDHYETVIRFCQFIEDNYETRNSEYSDDLSEVYVKLFRFSYEKGVMQASHTLEKHVINRAFYHEVYTNAVKGALISLNNKCRVAFFDEILAITDQSAIIPLTIEAIDQEHLENLVKNYPRLGSYVRYTLKSEMAAEGFVYRPEKSFDISENALKQIVLFLQKYPDIQNIIISFGLVDLPKIGLHNTIANSIITKQVLPQKRINGKIIRIFDTPNTEIVALESIIATPVKFLDDFGFFGSHSFKTSRLTHTIDHLNFRLDYDDKPTIFVFPIFLAVGGVERNTAEVISALQEKYNFVTITFERLKQSQGTLHHQFIQSCLGVYDLTELSVHDDIANYLRVLKCLYRPSLLWICNGSPWLEKNLNTIRELFHDAKIVDQQAYDINEGWIKLYKEKNPHLLDFDAFIAVNSKIKDLFLHVAEIKPKKIDLIYSVLSEERRNEALSKPLSALYEKYALNPLQKYIIFIGRMAPQKAPQDLIRLIKKIVDNYGNLYHFILVGSGEESNVISKMIQTNHLEKHITRFSYVENTYELELLCDAIIFTSRYEGLSIALLEALSVGTPALSTDVGDTQIILEKYKNGIIFEQIGNIDDYMSGFRNFVDHYSEFKNYAMLNKEKVITQFSKTTVSNQYITLFDQLLGVKKHDCR